MEILYQEKGFHAGKKIRKSDFAPLRKKKKIPGYAPAIHEDDFRLGKRLLKHIGRFCMTSVINIQIC